MNVKILGIRVQNQRDGERGDECTCGAELHNAEVEAVYAEILNRYDYLVLIDTSQEKSL